MDLESGTGKTMTYRSCPGSMKVVTPFAGADDENRPGALARPCPVRHAQSRPRIGRRPPWSCLSSPLSRRVRGVRAEMGSLRYD
jgi:hypothetical protein